MLGWNLSRQLAAWLALFSSLVDGRTRELAGGLFACLVRCGGGANVS